MTWRVVALIFALACFVAASLHVRASVEWRDAGFAFVVLSLIVT
jgi:hypothetical protein